MEFKVQALGFEGDYGNEVAYFFIEMSRVFDEFRNMGIINSDISLKEVIEFYKFGCKKVVVKYSCVCVCARAYACLGYRWSTILLILVVIIISVLLFLKVQKVNFTHIHWHMRSTYSFSECGIVLPTPLVQVEFLRFSQAMVKCRFPILSLAFHCFSLTL